MHAPIAFLIPYAAVFLILADWFFNLKTGHLFITINNERFRANYELINQEDKHYFWNLLDSVYPTFQIYRERTNRDIPLIKFFKASV